MLSDREIGDCVLTRLDDGRVRVDRADPIIHISTELLAHPSTCIVFVGVNIMTIGDVNPVTYRITERGARIVEAVKVG